MHRSADAVLVKGEKRYYFAKLTLFAPFCVKPLVLYFVFQSTLLLPCSWLASSLTNPSQTDKIQSVISQRLREEAPFLPGNHDRNKRIL
jgi:hypothetical protein